jgi:Rhodanese-like domain
MPILIPDDFSMQQFVRGYGEHISWHSDPVLMRAAKLEIDTHPSLASSKVIGVFGSVLHPRILFHQDNMVGAYSSYSRENFLLSQDNDFFEAGLEYSTYDKCSGPSTTEPLGRTSITTPAKLDDVQSEILKANDTLPPDTSPFPLLNQPQLPQTSKSEPESPSFFSPSFTEHLSDSSNGHDPRIHTINIPIHLTTPTRSNSCPSSASPALMSQTPSAHSIKKRNLSLRSPCQASETPSPNITPILPGELENLLSGQSALLVDIRAFPAYTKSRLVDAINVCTPTVLLKRSSFSLDDISKNIVLQADRGRFTKWKDADAIVIYDADSLQVKDSYRLAILATKFVRAGFKRTIYGLIGPATH